jgi:hypothetical protein
VKGEENILAYISGWYSSIWGKTIHTAINLDRQGKKKQIKMPNAHWRD